MSLNINIFDLFAGPGGLGEGFSSYIEHNSKKKPFSIVASVEKEESAHKTLLLRSFLRKFDKNAIPDVYYEYVRGEQISREQLFNAYPEESGEAIREVLEQPRALGADNVLIEKRIKEEVDRHSGMNVVIGGPPCQAYSLVGRARNMGTENYVAELDHRHYLYKEYLNILSIVEPEVFVMENVKGILSSKVDGKRIFSSIKEDLRDPGRVLGIKNCPKYRVYSLAVEAGDCFDPVYSKDSDYVIRSEDFGIPQARHRVILLGVRCDIDFKPEVLRSRGPVNVEDVIADLPRLRSGLSKEKDGDLEWGNVIQGVTCNLIRNLESTKGFGGVVSALQNNTKLEGLSRGGNHISFKAGNGMPSNLKPWFIDPNLHGVLNHQTRGHIRADLERYLFCSTFSQVHSCRENPTPKSKEFPEFLAPKHKNWSTGKFADRFRVQVKGRYATTITSHISKDGHYFIHHDPAQCRSLTVREAARIQTFPDNYFFEGNRTQQYVQVGNAVPPLLAHQIAGIVYNLLKSI